MTTQKITNIEIADFGDDGTTVSVTVKSANEEVTFHVQTVDGEHRGSLGCWILTDTSDGDIDSDDYPDFDIDAIVHAAENFISQEYELIDSGFQTKRGQTIYLLRALKGFKIVLENNNYFNEVTSPYTQKYLAFEDEESGVESFYDSEDEAKDQITMLLNAI